LLSVPKPALTLFAGLVLVIAGACGSSAATSTPGAGKSAASGAPSAASGVSATPFVMPSFAGDPVLAAKFPTTVAGSPVTNVTTARLVDFYRTFGTTAAQITTIGQALSTLGMDINTAVFGSATATVNGSSVGISAFRMPGQDANKLVDNYAVFSPLTAGQVLSKETVGGKSVTVVRDSSGYASTWLYASGDIVWSVDSSDVAEATAVFAAIS
jgi:hypothetical protein